MHKARVFAVLVWFSFIFGAAGRVAAQGTRPSFSGVWKKDNARSVPVRPGDVTLRIEQHDPDLTVEMTVVHPPKADGHAVQRYTTDGKESVSTGADGDSFHSKVVWRDDALVFTIVEHEDQNLINSLEVWTLSADGNTLTRVRRSDNGEQTIVYVRQR